MSVPPQFTAAGVGGAIPIDSLGRLLTSVNYDFVGTTTRAAITVYPTTLSATVIDGTVVPATTMVGTTISETTITGTARPTSGSKKGGASGKVELNALGIGLMLCFTYLAAICVW
jgi:hypothetical protein